MGKLYITNKTEWASELDNIYSNAGFKKNAHSGTVSTIATFGKLSSRSWNYCKYNDCELFCAGTFIYKMVFGEEALSKACEDFESKGVEYVKRNTRGSFVVTLRKEEDIYVFVDNIGTYSFYYYQESGNYILTNMYSHIAKCTNAKVNRLALMELAITVCILGNETPFQNVYRIEGNEILKIKMAAKSIENTLIDTANCASMPSKQILIDNLSRSIEEYGELKKTYFDRHVVFVTGGVDSRLMLAADAFAGINAECHYWGGLSDLQNYNPIDNDIGKKLSVIIDGSYKYHDISGDFVRNAVDRKVYDLMGDYCDLYGGNEKLNEVFLEFDNSTFVDYGYFGELLTDWEHLTANWHENFSLKEFVEKVYWNRFNCSYGKYDELLEKIYSKYIEISQKEKLHVDSLSLDDCMLLYSHYRIRADVVMCNYSNMFCNHFMLLGQTETFGLIQKIPYGFREGCGISLSLINKFCPKMIDVPFYSHGELKNINNLRFCTETEKESVKDSIKKAMIHVFGKRITYTIAKLISKSKIICGDKNQEKYENDYSTIDYCKKELASFKDLMDISWRPTRECIVSYLVSPLLMLRMIRNYCQNEK